MDLEKALGTEPTESSLTDPWQQHLAQSNWLKKEKNTGILKLIFLLQHLL